MSRAQRVERAFAGPVLVAALLVVPLLVLEGADLPGAWPTVLDVADWAMWAIFVAELAAMLWTVEDRGRWLREHPLDVVIVVFTVPVFSSAFEVLRVLRLLRLLRLARLARISKVLFSLEGLRYVGLLAVLTLVAGGEAFAQLENVSVGNGLYWAATTMTTVGYGNVSPTTTGGKLVAVAVMFLGIGFVAVLTGAIAERFLAPEVEEVESAVEAEEADLRRELREIADRLARLSARM